MANIEYKIKLSEVDILDITISRNEVGEVTKFVVNYRAQFKETGERWYEIYRIDTCHEYLHEQKFWRGPEPIRIEGKERTLEQVFDNAIDTLSSEYWKFKHLFRILKLGEILESWKKEGQRKKGR